MHSLLAFDAHIVSYNWEKFEEEKTTNNNNGRLGYVRIVDRTPSCGQND